MLLNFLAVLLLLLEAAFVDLTKPGLLASSDSPSRPTDLRKILGASRKRRSLDDGGERGQVVITDPTPLLLAEVVKDLGGGERGSCYVMVYYDPVTVPPEDLAIFQDAFHTPVTLVDVSKLKFSLITSSKQRVPLVDILRERPDPRCRLIVAWSSSTYQRGLLLIANAEPGVLSFRDTIILPVSDQRLDRFLPQIRRRVIVKRRGSRGGRGRRDLLSSRFLVQGVCQACEPYILRRLGEWRHPHGWTWGGIRSKDQGVSGADLTVSYTPSVPNIFPITINGEQRLEGVEIRLLEYAAKALNFTYKLVVPEDGEWGRPLNGSWTGKVGEIVKGRADIAIGGIVYTKERADVAKYTLMFHNELWGIVCPLSAKLPVWPYITFPFRSESASSVFKLLVILHVLAFLIVSIIGSEEDTAPRHPLTDSIFTTVRTGVSLYFRLMACVYFWNLYFVIMKAKYEPPVDTSAALLQSGKKWGIVSGTTVTRVLSTSYNPYHQELEYLAEPLKSIDEGYARLRNEGLCLVGVPKRYASATIATKHTTRCGEPGLQVSTEDLNSVLGGWLLPNGSPLVRPLDSVIRRLQSFGLLEYWRKELHDLLLIRGPRDLPCLNPPPAALSLSDLRLAFLVLLIGWALAFFFHCWEHVLHFLGNPSGYWQFIRGEANNNNTTITPSLRSRLHRWLQSIFSPVPSINISAKEATFRRQLDIILRDMWQLDIP